VNGDGFADVIVSADAGTSPQIQVFNGKTGAILANFFAFSAPQFRGGVRVAAGDVNGDGKADIIVAAGKGGGPQVQIYDGATLRAIANWYAFNAPTYTGGVYVGAGDVNGDGLADVICGAGGGATAQVTVYNSATTNGLKSFFAFGTGFKGGVRVAASNLTGTSRASILAVPGTGGQPLVQGFDSLTLGVLSSFFAFPQGFLGGNFVG
jgi:hypothetical protein